MSTKIYNGYRIKGATTLDEAFAALNTDANRKWVATRIEELTREYLALRVTRVIDRSYLEPDNEEAVRAAKHAVMSCLSELWKDQREARAEGRRDHLIDFDLDVSLIPVGKRQHRQVVALIFAQRECHRDWFSKLDCVEDFSYWDNSDRPEEVSAPEWRKRKRVWEQACPGHTTPAERGVTLQFHPPQPCMPTQRDLLRAFMADIPTRAVGYAEDHVCSMALKKLQVGIAEQDRLKDFWAHYRKADKYAKSEEGRAAIAKIAAVYETALPNLQELDF
jgi:hypothetical protein